MKGMTGFGSAKSKVGASEVSLEIRSTNHRFLEIVFHLPDGFYYLEDNLRNVIAAKLKRGRVVATVNITGRPKQRIVLNESAIRHYAREIKSLSKEAGFAATFDAGSLLALPGVLNVYEEHNDRSKLSSAITALVVRALDDLLGMRCREGATIKSDLTHRIERVSRLAGSIELRFRKVVESRLKRLKTPEEQSAFIKNSDITEELVRIKHHLKNFLRNICRDSVSGKELDFIAQEIQREANTTGAKSIDALISSSVVRIKSEIEKIREQLQNAE